MPMLRSAPSLALLALTLSACYQGGGEASGGGGSQTAPASASDTDTDTGAATTTDDDTSSSGGGGGGGSGGSGSAATTDETETGVDAGTTDATTTDTTDATTTGVDPTTDATTGSSSSSTTGDTDDTGDTGGDPNDNTTPAGVCARWKQDRADLSNGPWSGDAAACNAGDTTPQGRANALKMINLHRWLADLPPVTHDPTRDAKAQKCALMMHANNALSHNPPMSWKCYSADGAEGAGKSNIATTSGVVAIDLYMADPGNPTTIGHRRWILANNLGPVGLGSTDKYSCMWVIGGSGGGDNEWTAWPPPGPFPFQAIKASWESIDSTGWTVQSSAINLAGAQVKVTSDGQDRPMKVTQLLGGYGSTYAISMIPQGWQSQVGKTYEVSISGISQPINYQFTLVDCL
jgi:uncharacterized protein YkwD